MRVIVSILLLLTHILILKSKEDKRANLEVIGGVNELSVSPDGNIWLTTSMSRTYYTRGIDSLWYKGDSFHDTLDIYSAGNPNLDRISFFNKDTAILTGYISAKENDFRKNGYYLTADAGKTWVKSDFGGRQWIYDVYTNNNGQAWMGGSSGNIFYTSDFGKNWKKLKSPFNSSTRVNSIFMSDSLYGFAGALDNELYKTRDNWNTFENIMTPIDQFSEEADYISNDKIEKILIWNETIIVKQSGLVFYSDIDSINWRFFDKNIIDIALDNHLNTIFAITDSLEICRFKNMKECIIISNRKLQSYPKDLKSVNNSLYVLTQNNMIFYINEHTFKEVIPYTLDYSIPEPDIIRVIDSYKYGASGRDLLRYSNGRWSRELTTAFNINDFYFENKNNVILWDGYGNNYKYELEKKELSQFFHKNPFSELFNFDIKSLNIDFGFRSCYRKSKHKIDFKKDNHNLFNSEQYVHITSDSNEIIFNNSFKKENLVEILKTINNNPYKIPGIKEFKITEKVKSEFLEYLNNKLIEDTKRTSDQIDSIRENYKNLIDTIDKTESSKIKAYIDNVYDINATINNWFRISIVNDNNDTLNISKEYYLNSAPWNLPWIFEFKNKYFYSYDVSFSKFINNCIPQNSLYARFFDNKYFLNELSNYLLHNK
ncbi:MAG: WD40/YVTN/BNR-like repeat-containing protein [Chlorobiota bacterium]